MEALDQAQALAAGRVYADHLGDHVLACGQAQGQTVEPSR